MNNNPTGSRPPLARAWHKIKREKLRTKEKVFGIGFGKTGTTTLSTALEYLDYHSLRWHISRNKPYGQPNWVADEKGLVQSEFFRLTEMMKDYDCTEDVPWPVYFRELDEMFPDAKFILTVRKTDVWIDSCIRHFGYYSGSYSGVPEELRKLNFASHEAFYGLGNGNPIEASAAWIRKYEEHISAVQEHFRGRPNKLLVIDWSASSNPWRELCHFLNKPIPEVRFPHSNSGK